MRILIDTNIILDYLGVNIGYEENASEILQLAIKDEYIVEMISSSAVTDIYYVLRRATKDKYEALLKLQAIREFIRILPTTEADIDRAINRHWKDFEDAVQYSVAESNNIDCIVSRNIDDFEEKEIPSYTPEEFLNLITK